MTANRVETSPETVERDLVKLVLTVVELLRQLMERQALRRVDAGNLTDDQEEQIGLTLLHLDDAMIRLCDHFGIAESDLNLDLGPLGTLCAHRDAGALGFLPRSHPRSGSSVGRASA